jgi:antitoxin component YwqK of YwqJK toxin-antitoxin module
MRLLYLIFPLFSIGMLLMPKETKAIADTLNQTDAGNLRQGWWIFDNMEGRLNDCPADRKVEEGRYINNLREGQWTGYYCSGKLKFQITYLHDRKIGPARMFYSNGIVSEEGYWNINHWEGGYRFFHHNGKPYHEFSFNSAGKREGLQRYYHESGKLMTEGVWHESKESGTIKEYNSQGQLIAEKTYNDGQLDPSSTKTYTPAPVEEEPNPAPPPRPPIVEEKKSEPKAPEKLGVISDGFHKTFTREGKIQREGEFRGGTMVDGKAYVYEGGVIVKTLIYKNGAVVKTLQGDFSDKK